VLAEARGVLPRGVLAGFRREVVGREVFCEGTPFSSSLRSLPSLPRLPPPLSLPLTFTPLPPSLLTLRLLTGKRSRMEGILRSTRAVPVQVLVLRPRVLRPSFRAHEKNPHAPRRGWGRGEGRKPREGEGGGGGGREPARAEGGIRGAQHRARFSGPRADFHSGGMGQVLFLFYSKYIYIIYFYFYF
jgi:hypothetical protein